MNPRAVDVEVSRRLRLLLADRLIALSWALKGSPCAHRLFIIVRWLIPEAKRFLVRRIGLHNHNRRMIELAVYLGTLLRRIPPGVVASFLIVAAFVGALDLAMRTTATETQPLVEKSALRHEPQLPSDNSIMSVSKSSDVSETGSLSGAQAAPVPLPERKPERVYKVPRGKGASAKPATQKRMTHQQKKSRLKRDSAAKNKSSS